MLIAAGRGPARVPTCENALRYVRAKFYHLVAAQNEGWFMADTLRHDLRFEKWQDDYDAKTRAVRLARLRTIRVDDFSPVLVRALSLFGPGELRALRVVDADVFSLVTSLLQTASASGGGPAPQIGQAMDALCAVHAGGFFSPSPDMSSLVAVLQRHAATITEFHAELTAKELEHVSLALACCTRLESLTGPRLYDPAIWLGLSHLHTLRGADLGKVSFAAIAAALPKLHTLKAFGHCNPAQAADFITDLLPRLRVLYFSGRWPDVQEERGATFAPLRLLQELVWDVSDYIAPREFLGAQPTVLDVPYTLVWQCWLGAVDAPSASFLARVCDLRIKPAPDLDPLDPADVARMLCAAPQLKKFFAARYVQGDASWLAPTAPTHPAFDGLVHPTLREFGIRTARVGTPAATPPDTEWTVHLRRRHFPRLRELVVGDEKYFVTSLDRVSSEAGSAA
jgi:hypothetical protein